MAEWTLSRGEYSSLCDGGTVDVQPVPSQSKDVMQLIHLACPCLQGTSAREGGASDVLERTFSCEGVPEAVILHRFLEFGL
jgi:hypothetical protein